MSRNIRFQSVSNTGDWDSRLLRYPLAHPYQSTAYGDHHAAKGSRSEYTEIYRDDERVGMCLALVEPDGTANWHRGPIVSPSVEAEYGEILAGFADFLSRKGVVCIRDATTRFCPQKDFYRANWPKLSGEYEAPYVDLASDFATLEKGFDRSLRKNLRKCDEAGVTVGFRDDEASIQGYEDMLRFHRESQGFGMPDVYPNSRSMRLFNRPGISMEVAMASVDGELLAGLGYIRFGEVVIEVGSAQSRAYHERKLPAYEMIKVEAIRRYGGMGLRIYDLMGIKRDPADEKEANIRRFKLKFTDTIGEYGHIGLEVLNPVSFFKLRVRNRVKRLTASISRPRGSVHRA
jgi:hypothetical protein